MNAATGRQVDQPRSEQNVSDGERWFSMIAGAALAAAGLSGRGKTSWLTALVGGGLIYRGVTGHCHTYAALGIDTSQRKSTTVIPAQHGCKVEKKITINRPAAELYSFWRDVENLPRVMSHVKSIEATDRVRSHWTADGVFGKSVEWDAEIFNDRENELIAWRSVPGGQVDTAGSVRFTELPHGRGTEVTIEMKYDPPAGKIGAWVATLSGSDPAKLIEEDLRRFKSVMEAGEAPTIEGQPRGQGAAPR
jgi:uncharacterized membrane protein